MRQANMPKGKAACPARAQPFEIWESGPQREPTVTPLPHSRVQCHCVRCATDSAETISKCARRGATKAARWLRTRRTTLGFYLDESARSVFRAHATICRFLERAERLDMRKRPATAGSTNYNFIKAYFELKKLREDIEYIERSSRPSPGQATIAGRDASKGDDGIRGILRS
jgi:hypothetical protein